MTKRSHYLGRKVLLSGIILLLASGSPAQQRRIEISKPAVSSQAKSSGRQAVSAVGLILVRNGGDPAEPRPRGSAVIISRDGLVATNYHVITQDKTGNIFDDIYIALAGEDSTADLSKRYRLKIISLNRPQDLALLRIVADSLNRPLPQATSFPALPLGDARSLKLLDDLIIIGFPQSGGLSATVNVGVVEGKDEVNHWIKTDARFIHGNSGGAAVNSKGELVGIPTKVVVDTKRIEGNGGGPPNQEVPIGAVGFLRPAYLLKEMLEQSRGTDTPGVQIIPRLAIPDPPQKGSSNKPEAEVILRGVVKSIATGKPVAGAQAGLVPLGVAEVNADNLLTWGGTNAEGKFVMNNAVAPGRYLLKVKAFAYEVYSREIEVKVNPPDITVELRPEKK